MSPHPLTRAVRDGRAAVVGGVLLALSFGVELVHPVQQKDGTVDEPVTIAVLIAMWGLAMLCFTLTFARLGRLHGEAGSPFSRAGRVGVRTAMLGGSLHVLFAVVVGITATVSGSPWEPSFVLFAFGFLLLVVGGVLLGVAVRRRGVLPGAAVPLWSGAAAAFVAIAVFTDPWHDLALLGYASSWVVLGLDLYRRTDGRSPISGAQEPTPVVTSRTA